MLRRGEGGLGSDSGSKNSFGLSTHSVTPFNMGYNHPMELIAVGCCGKQSSQCLKQHNRWWEASHGQIQWSSQSSISGHVCSASCQVLKGCRREKIPLSMPSFYTLVAVKARRINLVDFWSSIAFSSNLHWLRVKPGFCHRLLCNSCSHFQCCSPHPTEVSKFVSQGKERVFPDCSHICTTKPCPILLLSSYSENCLHLLQRKCLHATDFKRYLGVRLYQLSIHVMTVPSFYHPFSRYWALTEPLLSSPFPQVLSWCRTQELLS